MLEAKVHRSRPERDKGIYDVEMALDEIAKVINAE
jgi:hypothetical protein